MTAVEDQLRQALAHFMQVSATRDPGKISAALRTIEEIHRKLPPNTHPQLRHYLERRSYQKALEFLGGGDPEKGSCGR